MSKLDKRGHSADSYQIHQRRLTISHLRGPELDSLFALHRFIVERLSSRDLYRANTREFFARHFGAEGLTLGVFDGAVIVGYALLRFPQLMDDNLGRDFGIEGDALNSVTHLEECGIHPCYRGLGLQKELTTRRIQIATALAYRDVFVTIAPANLPSLKSHLRHGLLVCAVKAKYGGLTRFILRRRLLAEDALDRNRAVSCPLKDVHRIGELTRSGFAGFVLGDSDNSLEMAPWSATPARG